MLPLPSKPGRWFGIHWDEDLKPLCPADETLLSHWKRVKDGNYDILRCAKCRTQFRMRHEELGNLTLSQAKNEIIDITRRRLKGLPE